MKLLTIILIIYKIHLKIQSKFYLRNVIFNSKSFFKLRQTNISKCFGSKVWCHSEKAIAANCSAVREWDSNGTVFGYNHNIKGHNAGEFGHNDFYPVVIAAC